MKKSQAIPKHILQKCQAVFAMDPTARDFNISTDLADHFSYVSGDNGAVYTQWVAKVYSQGDVKVEDLGRNGIFNMYVNAKRRNKVPKQWKDINKFKTHVVFENFVWEHCDIDGPTNVKKPSDDEYVELYKDDEVRVIIPKTKLAAQYYGMGTKWCTAATVGDNYFDTYAKSGDLFIIIPRHPKDKDDKYQLHIFEMQFMNAKDEAASLDEFNVRFPNAYNAIMKTKNSHLTSMLWDDEFKAKVYEMTKQTLDELNFSVTDCPSYAAFCDMLDDEGPVLLTLPSNVGMMDVISDCGTIAGVIGGGILCFAEYEHICDAIDNRLAVLANGLTN